MTTPRSPGAGTISVEPMSPLDWPDVARILAEEIATGEATFETEVPEWDGWDRAHLAEPRVVARIDGRVVGWAALSPASPRPVYAGVAELTVYVAAEARGRGVGRALLEGLVERAEDAGIWTLQAVMFPENEASVRLHRRLGFRVVGTRERIARHRGRWRDTVLLERRSPRIS